MNRVTAGSAHMAADAGKSSMRCGRNRSRCVTTSGGIGDDGAFRLEYQLMVPAYWAVTITLAVIVLFSGIAKMRRDPKVVAVINETVGMPMKYFTLLAALEFAGALGLIAGLAWRALGLAAAMGLVFYFVGAVVSHLRVGDVKGIGPAAFLLVMSAGALALRCLTQ